MLICLFLICLLVVLSRSTIKHLKQIVKEHFLAGTEVGESVHMKAVGVVCNLESFHSNHKNSCLCTKSFVDKQGGAWHDEILMWEILLKVIIDLCVVVMVTRGA